MADVEQELILLVGLGNPGAAYVHTRHNFGQFVLDNFARVHGMKWVNNKLLNADLARGRFGKRNCILVRPLSSMNESGYPVMRVSNYFRVKAGNVAVVYDDINLPLGTYKVTVRNGAGGHNGMADVNAWNRDCLRFRLGIGHKTDGEMPLRDFVLGKFSDEEQAAILYAMDEILDGLRRLVTDLQRPLDNGHSDSVERQPLN
ncbi:MAG: aminoacyl-tRNA hydrolase [Puniceicoccales bacterium]|jgi:PTH1 family peptidyl-tRNA hydrolase|nr:aminoacyl-tRNA hydrolase [Puniceicoccales bacterium]